MESEVEIPKRRVWKGDFIACNKVAAGYSILGFN